MQTIHSSSDNEMRIGTRIFSTDSVGEETHETCRTDSLGHMRTNISCLVVELGLLANVGGPTTEPHNMTCRSQKHDSDGGVGRIPDTSSLDGSASCVADRIAFHIAVPTADKFIVNFHLYNCQLTSLAATSIDFTGHTSACEMTEVRENHQPRIISLPVR